MIAALESLRRNHLVETEHQALATLKISGRPKGIMAFLMTHPPLEARIERLRMQRAA
jgi:Zn-dependent protease with chaperone function